MADPVEVASFGLADLEEASVSVDDGEKVFTCWLRVNRQYWNGWDCPLFEWAVAVQVAEAYGGRWDSDRRVFVFPSGFAGIDDDFSGLLVFGEGGEAKVLYPVGAWAWVWEEVNR